MITGHGNTGYAGYFINTDTSSNSNYGVYGTVKSTGSQSSGVYGECDSVNCAGTVGISTSGDGVYGSGGLAGIFGNGGTTTSIAVEGQQAIAANTGYAGYFANTGTGAINYGIYASVASATGYAGYFQGNIALTGSATFKGATSGTVTVQVPAVAGATTFQLPSSNGTSGFVLSTDGTGVTSWVSNAGTASTALSGITVAAAAHTINNVNWAQTWNWNSLTTQTAMTFASSSLTNGNDCEHPEHGCRR